MYLPSGLILGLAFLSSAIAQIQYGESDDGYAYKKSGTPFNSGYTKDCQGDDKLCVARENCVNGFVRNFQGLAKAGHQNRKCEANQEVCCNLRTGDDAESSNVIVSKTGGLFDSVEDDEQVNNGYLPPKDAKLPSPSDNFGNIIVPPKADPVDEGRIDLGPQIGCAAALLCVPEPRCNAIGMIVEQDVFYTEEELLRRVPMVDCINPETGIQGKCCRDPNYEDPWPAQPIPPNYKGGFDQQGFPKIWNLTYSTPAPGLRPVAQPAKRPENIPRPNQFPNTNKPIQIPRPAGFPPSNQPIGAPSHNEPVTDRHYNVKAPTQATPRPVNAGLNLGAIVPLTRPPPPRSPVPTFAPKQPVAVEQPIRLSTDVRDFINPHQPGKKCGLINQGSIKDCQ